MANLTPKAEGVAPESAYDGVRAAFLKLLAPILDGKVGQADAISMGTTALLETVPAIRALPDGATLKISAAALLSIAAEIGVDLVVTYPDEVQTASTPSSS